MLRETLAKATCALMGLLLLGVGGLLGQEPPKFTLVGVVGARVLKSPPHGAFLEQLDLGDKIALMVTASLTGGPGRASVTSDDVVLRYVENGETKDVTCVAIPFVTPDDLTVGISEWSTTKSYKPAALYVNFDLPPPRQVRFVFAVPKTFETAWLVQKRAGGGDLVTKEIPEILDK